MSSTYRACPICNNLSFKEFYRRRHNLCSGHPLVGEYIAVVCQNCGMVFNQTAYSPQSIRKYYQEFSKYIPRKKLNVDTYYYEIARILSELVPDQSSVVLDIGCGGGELLTALRDAGFSNLMGMDPSPDCVKHITQNLNIPCWVGNLDKDVFPSAICDVAVSTGVFEHLMDPVAAARRLVNLINPGGCAFVLVPDLARYTIHLSTPFQEFSVEHINHFSRCSLANVFSSVGWDLVNCGEIDRVVTSTCCYPDLWILIRMSEISTTLEKDLASADFLSSYIDSSTVLLNKINDHLYHQFTDINQYLIWGAGQMSSLLLGETIMRERQPVAVIDENPSYTGRSLAGAYILNGDMAHAMRDRTEIKDVPIVIATLREVTAIMNWIRSRGWANRIITLLPEKN